MKAIIPAAGFGTRFFPASKTLPKEMLPIGNKPAIQWIVEEAIAAGATEVIIVTSPEKEVLRRHFESSAIWRERLSGKPDFLKEAEALDALSERVRFVEQTEQRGLGHAVLQTAALLRDEREPILILLGDALVAGVVPCAVDLVARSRAHGGVSMVGLERVPRERVSRYGIVAGVPLADDPNVFCLSDLVEKPRAEDAPSDLAIAGRYMLSPEIFRFLETQTPGVGGEIQLTDAIRHLLTCQTVLGYHYPGVRQDIGTPAGYLRALQAMK